MAIQIIESTTAEADSPVSFNQEKWLLFDEASTLLRGVKAPPFQSIIGIELQGELDASGLYAALCTVVNRHAALRVQFSVSAVPNALRRASLQSYFSFRPSLPDLYRQVILPSVEVRPVFLSVKGLEPTQQERVILKLLDEQWDLPFDLEHPPFIRATLVEVGLQSHVLILIISHLVSDLLSLALLKQELWHAYTSRRNGIKENFKPLVSHFPDFAHWQRNRLPELATKGTLGYWQQQWKMLEHAQLDPDELPWTLPVGRRSASIAANIVRLPLSSGIWASINRLCRELLVTPNIVFRAAFTALLAQYTGRSRIPVWGNFANRVRAGTPRMIGWFANSHLVALDLNDTPSFAGLLRQCHVKIQEALLHQETPTSFLWRKFDIPPKVANGGILFDYISETPLEPLIADTSTNLAMTSMDVAPWLSGRSTFIQGLYVQVARREQGIILKACAPAGQFDATAIANMLRELVETIQLLIATPTIPISEVLGALRLGGNGSSRQRFRP